MKRNGLVDVDRLNLPDKRGINIHDLCQLLLGQTLQLTVVGHFQAEHLVVVLEIVLHSHHPKNYYRGLPCELLYDIVTINITVAIIFLCSEGTLRESIWARSETACFTGHRAIRKKDTLTLPETLRVTVKGLIQAGYTRFLTGGARGFDTLAAMTVLRCQAEHPEIKLILVLPFPNQYERETGWTEAEIAEYQAMKEAAAEVICLRQSYGRGCYHERNRFLVDSSSVCVAYQCRPSGGTAYTVRYAIEQGLQIIQCAERSIGEKSI